jgi:hypothetical protein
MDNGFLKRTIRNRKRLLCIKHEITKQIRETNNAKDENL